MVAYFYINLKYIFYDSLEIGDISVVKETWKCKFTVPFKFICIVINRKKETFYVTIGRTFLCDLDILWIFQSHLLWEWENSSLPCASVRKFTIFQNFVNSVCLCLKSSHHISVFLWRNTLILMCCFALIRFLFVVCALILSFSILKNESYKIK